MTLITCKRWLIVNVTMVFQHLFGNWLFKHNIVVATINRPHWQTYEKFYLNCRWVVLPEGVTLVVGRRLCLSIRRPQLFPLTILLNSVFLLGRLLGALLFVPNKTGGLSLSWVTTHGYSSESQGPADDFFHYSSLRHQSSWHLLRLFEVCKIISPTLLLSTLSLFVTHSCVLVLQESRTNGYIVFKETLRFVVYLFFILWLVTLPDSRYNRVSCVVRY